MKSSRLQKEIWTHPNLSKNCCYMLLYLAQSQCKSKLQRLLAVFTVSMTALLEPSVPLSRTLNSLHKSNENSADVQIDGWYKISMIYFSRSHRLEYFFCWLNARRKIKQLGYQIKWLSIFSDSCGIRAQCKEMRFGLFPNSSVYHACVKPQHFLWQNQSLIQNFSWLRTLQRRIKTSIFPHINFYLAWVLQSECEMSGHPGDLPAKFKRWRDGLVIHIYIQRAGKTISFP